MFRRRSQDLALKREPSQIGIDHLRSLAKLRHLLPKQHREYLRKLKSRGVEPRVIYDVGSHVLHWTREAKTVWSDALCFAFEAMHEVAPIYDEERVQYHLGVLSDRDDKKVKFYVSGASAKWVQHLAGQRRRDGAACDGAGGGPR